MLEKYRGSLDWLEEGELRSWVEAGNSPYTNPEGVIHKDGILRSWVEAGNSPYTNPEGVIHKDGIQLDFIEWHRSARWITEEIQFSQPSHFDYICSYAESEFSPRSKKEAIEILRHLQQLLGNEARDYMGFLRSENLMERYMEYKYCEELPFT